MLWIVKMSFSKHYFFIYIFLALSPFHHYSCVDLLTVVHHCCLAGLTVNPRTGGSGLSRFLLLACKAQTSSGKFSSVLILAVIPLYVRVYEVLTKSFLFSLSLSPSLPLFLPLGLHLQRFNFNSPVERERFLYFVGTETGLF